MAGIFITGASGMLGMYLASSLLAKKHKVIAVDSKPNDFVGKDPNYTFVQCDITDKGAISDLLYKHSSDIQTMVHLACSVDNDIDSYVTDEEVKKSKIADKYIYEAAVNARVKSIILLSTTHVYGTPKGREPIRETADIKGSSNYVDMKLNAEKMLMKEIKKTAVVPVIARVAPVYTSEYTQNLRDKVYDPKEDIAFVYNDGEYGFSFCCVFNLIDFINGIINIPQGRYEGVYNVADTRQITAKEILEHEREHHRIGAVIQKSMTGDTLKSLVSLGKNRQKMDYRFFDPSTINNNWNIDNTKAQRISTFRWNLKNTK